METNTVSTVPSTNEDGEQGFIGNVNANEQQPNSTPPSKKEVATSSPPTPNNNSNQTSINSIRQDCLSPEKEKKRRVSMMSTY